jgi:hypothetical protein
MSNQSHSWYVPGEGSQPAGPFTSEELIQSWRAGKISDKTMCWREGMTQWLPLTQVEPFASAMASAGVPRQSPRRILVVSAATVGLVLLLLALVILALQAKRKRDAAKHQEENASTRSASENGGAPVDIKMTGENNGAQIDPNGVYPPDPTPWPEGPKPPGPTVEPSDGTRELGPLFLPPVIGPTDDGTMDSTQPPVIRQRIEDLEAKLLRRKRTINTSTAVYDAVTNKEIWIIEVADTCTADQFDAEQTRLLRDWVSQGGVLWVNSNVLGLFGVRYSPLTSSSGPEECVPAGGSHAILEGCKKVVLNLPYSMFGEKCQAAHTLAYRGVIPLLSSHREVSSVPLHTPAGITLWSLLPYGKGWISDPKLVDVTREDGALFWGRFCQFCLRELPWPTPDTGSNTSGEQPSLPPDQGVLTGIWQASNGDQFRIEDDGKTITIDLASRSNTLRVFSGELTRTDEKPEAKALTGKPKAKAFTGTLNAVFTVGAAKQYNIDVTATFTDQDHLRLRCPRWPRWFNGRDIGTRPMNETWIRSNVGPIR